MKKKGIATLALAGALAVSMVPAFAASNTTAVGYTANGNASTDGQVMVTVPKNVAFTDTAKSVSNFNVKSYVWDAAANSGIGGWQEASATNKLNKTINVSVTSSKGFKLVNNNHSSVVGEYKYTVEGKELTTETGTTKTPIGTLQDTGEKYTLTGSLEMTVTPELDLSNGHAYFGDLLTYEFGGL